jgi:hypothetical protein
MPPHSSHLLQPLDVGCFSPFTRVCSIIMSKAIIERLKKTCHSIHRPRRPPELFKYELLDRQESALRLITVLPDLSTEGHIQCSLYNASSRTHRSYSCLSYTWGSPRPKRAVLIDGCIFYVQPSLFNFLDIARTMRTTVEYWPDHFWIDAICIDQSNTIERNRQVTRMGEIYDGANLVVAWLGHTENEQLLRQACDYLDPLSNDRRRSCTKTWPTTSTGLEDGLPRSSSLRTQSSLYTALHRSILRHSCVSCTILQLKNTV